MENRNDVETDYRYADAMMAEREKQKPWTQDQFRNRLHILHRIDGRQLPDLSKDQQRAFVRAPFDYFLRAPDDQQAAIWREIEKRQKE